jgi:hypothetical protein
MALKLMATVGKALKDFGTNKPEIKEGKIERPNRPKNIIKMPKGEEYKIKTNIIWKLDLSMIVQNYKKANVIK